MDSPGTRHFLPSLLGHVRTLAPGLPLEPVLVQVLLLCIVAGDDKHLILRARDDDVALVSKLTTLVLGALFGYDARRFRCHSPHQTPSDFLSSLFSPADHRHWHKPASRNASKLPIVPSSSVSSTARTSTASHRSDSKTKLDSLDPDALTKTHRRHASRTSVEPPKLPSALVVSGLELTSLPCQKALRRTLVERSIAVSDTGEFGHDHDGLTLALPDGFLIVYVCRSDARERPPIHKSLLDLFAMSSSVDVSAQTRLAMRQYRPPSSPSSSASFASPLTSSAFSTPEPVIPSALVQRLKYLCANHARIRPPLSIYLADLFSATRHYGPLEAMLLTVRARQDAEALARASRVLGTDSTGAELVKEHTDQPHDTGSNSTYPHSHPSVASESADPLLDGVDICQPLEGSSVRSLASQPEDVIDLDVSEADIARMFPRVVSHRIRVRDSPFDEILSSAVCGATANPPRSNESQDGETAQQRWERETVKDVLVRILADV